jgi:hypothetical protein
MPSMPSSAEVVRFSQVIAATLVVTSLVYLVLGILSYLIEP